MDPALREQLRLNLLQQADAASQLGLTATAYRLGAQTQGYAVDLPQIGTEIAYLMDKGLLAPAPKHISPEISRFRITAAGRDFLAVGGH